MTGTAKTEEKEFVEIYNLHVVEIPTNVSPSRALDENDFIFKTPEAKFSCQCSTTSSSATRRASPCSSARSRSRPSEYLLGAPEAHAGSRTTC